MERIAPSEYVPKRGRSPAGAAVISRSSGIGCGAMAVVHAVVERGRDGARSRTRTADPLLTMEVLCQLS